MLSNSITREKTSEPTNVWHCVEFQISSAADGVQAQVLSTFYDSIIPFQLQLQSEGKRQVMSWRKFEVWWQNLNLWIANVEVLNDKSLCIDEGKFWAGICQCSFLFQIKLFDTKTLRLRAFRKTFFFPFCHLICLQAPSALWFADRFQNTCN